MWRLLYVLVLLQVEIAYMRRLHTDYYVTLNANNNIDINTNAITFTHPESFLRRNFLSSDTSHEKSVLRDMFHKQTLVNLRTYDSEALIFYANDHLNNFVHLYIENGTQVVYSFNHGNKIYNVTVQYSELNSSKSVQIAIERGKNKTTVHVNDKNQSIPYGVLLLEEYSHKPWINPEAEVLAPQRPPAPPTEYFQLNLGGYDPETLLKVSEYPLHLPGYVGCLRGLQIGDTLIDLPSKIKKNDTGVIANCTMKCDDEPCKHGGICIENFRNQTHTCDCEHTSYYGPFCKDEKGADFSGESMLWRTYVLNGSVDYVKVQLAFSSMDEKQKNTILLLLQTENDRSYYLLVALTLEGYLNVQEDREGNSDIYSATVNTKSFINGARHSVYYRRIGNESELLIDREIIPMVQMQAQTFANIPETGANDVQIGGHNTADPRFAIYKYYSGCLSNIFIEINDQVMRPLDEYMLFKKDGAEKVNVSNPQGVRSAQCSSDFDVIHSKIPGPKNLNISHGKDKTWVQDAPQRILYTSQYSTDDEEEEGTEKIVVIVLATFFVLVIILGSYHLYRTDKKYKERKELETDTDILFSKQQAAILQQENNKPLPDIDDKPKPALNGKIPTEEKTNVLINGNGKNVEADAEVEVIPVSEEIPLKPLKRVDSKKEKRISFRDSASELSWDTPEENTELLSTMREEDEDLYKDSDDSEIEELQKPITNGNYTLLDNTDSMDNGNHKTNGDANNKALTNGSNIKFNPNLKPVFLNEHQRKFGNPISYLGGPRLPARNRSSVESVLSLD